MDSLSKVDERVKTGISITTALAIASNTAIGFMTFDENVMQGFSWFVQVYAVFLFVTAFFVSFQGSKAILNDERGVFDGF